MDKDNTLEEEGERDREGKGARTLFAGIDIKFQVSRGKCENKEKHIIRSRKGYALAVNHP